MAQPPYVCIPPPPLPEFYMASKQTPPCAASMEIVRAVPLSTLPRQSVTQVPPLAIYHICRICLRPRSARYHLEHPIPVNGVPPPPGICRRCRVSSVSEHTTVTEFVKQAERNEVKLGLRCLYRDEDYITHDEMAARRQSFLRRQAEYNEQPDSEREIMYRHVRVVEAPSSSPPRPRVDETSTSRDAILAVRGHTLQTLPPPPILSITRAENSNGKTASEAHTASFRNETSLEVAKVGSAKASESEQSSVSSRPQKKVRSRDLHSTHHVIISVDQPAPRKERPESEIRRIAREEVEKYRQAERKLEAHGDAYAHGRLVPVERRISMASGAMEGKPWSRESEKQGKEVDYLKIEAKPRARQVEQYEEAVITRSRAKKSPSVQPGNNGPQESSTASSSKGPPSDKTYWPSAKRSVDVVPPRAKSKSSAQEMTQHLQPPPFTDRPRPQPPRPSTSKRYEIIEVIERVDRSPTRKPVSESVKTKEGPVKHKEEPVPERVEELIRDFQRKGRGETYVDVHWDRPRSNHSSRWTDREYWYYDEPVGPAQAVKPKDVTSVGNANLRDDSKPAQDEERRPSAPARPSMGGDPQAEKSTNQKVHGLQSDTTVRREPMQQAEPRAPKSQQAQSQAPSSEPETDYYYAKRTVQAIPRPPGGKPSSYFETSETFSRRRPEKIRDDPRPPPQRQDNTAKQNDDLSRVRFSSKIEISPTPPGSDASSRHFRDVGRMKSRPEEKAGGDRAYVVEYEYEHRGRSQTREPPPRRYYFDPTTVPSQLQSTQARPSEPDGDRPRSYRRPPAKQTPSQASGVPLSESPSREHLAKMARDAAQDPTEGDGPYVLDARSRSCLAIDGSISGSSDSERGQRSRRSSRRSGQR